MSQQVRDYLKSLIGTPGHEARFQAASKGQYQRTGETRQPFPGEYYIGRTGLVHYYAPGSLVLGEFEILREVAPKSLGLVN